LEKTRDRPRFHAPRVRRKRRGVVRYGSRAEHRMRHYKSAATTSYPHMPRVSEWSPDIVIRSGTLESVRGGQWLFVYKLGEIGAGSIRSAQCSLDNSEELRLSYGIERVEWHVEALPAMLSASLINDAACRCNAIIFHWVIMTSMNGCGYIPALETTRTGSQRPA
jgi:hypothetical protein